MCKNVQKMKADLSLIALMESNKIWCSPNLSPNCWPISVKDVSTVFKVSLKSFRRLNTSPSGTMLSRMRFLTTPW